LPGDQTSILEVVRNPSWRIPYIACAMMAVGMIFQFLLSLTRFWNRHRAADYSVA
jgi:hypothetical protein